MKLYFLVLLLLGLQGCVAYPKEVWNRADYKRCDLVSREYELKISDKPLKVAGRVTKTNEAIGLLVMSGVVFSASAVVSGSLVLVGNTIHFLEKQGRCDDSMLNQTIDAFTKPFIDEGGELIEGPQPSKVAEHDMNMDNE